jgi:3-oxoacyl-[acyl-carrier protein] reductase
VPDQKRSVIVTGSNGEIGTAICQRLTLDGIRVFAVTRKPHRFIGVDHDLLSNVVVSSIEDEDAIDSLLNTELLDEVSSIGLVYGAAMFHRFPAIDVIGAADWQAILGVNLVACFLWNRKIASFSMEREIPCSIVNITSQAAFTGGYGGVVPYAASKGAMISMSKGLAREYATRRVRVNCVAPGFIETGAMRGNLDSERLKFFFDRVPMERFGTVNEVAAVTSFLLSDESAYVTGATLDVTGGQLMH